MTDFFVEFEERDDDYNWQAAMLAVIDQATGARLTSEWLEEPHPYATARMSTLNPRMLGWETITTISGSDLRQAVIVAAQPHS